MVTRMVIPIRRTALVLLLVLAYLPVISGAGRSSGYRPYAGGVPPPQSYDDDGWSDSDYSDYSDVSDAYYGDSDGGYSDYEAEKHPLDRTIYEDDVRLDLSDDGGYDPYDNEVDGFSEHEDVVTPARRRMGLPPLFGLSDDEGSEVPSSTKVMDKGALYDAYNELHSLAQVRDHVNRRVWSHCFFSYLLILFYRPMINLLTHLLL